MRHCRVERYALAALLCASGAGGALAQGALTPIAPAPQLFNAPRDLRLIVFINGENTQFFETFVLDPATNRLAARRADLNEAGVRTPDGAPNDPIFIDALGVPYSYDAPNQRIYFTLSDAQRLPRVYDAQRSADRPKPRSDFGALLNYSFFGGMIRDLKTGTTSFSGANALLDGRVFSDFGVLSQTGVVGSTLSQTSSAHFLRLETTYTFSDVDNSTTYRVGDTISGATAWSRPIRLGGGQMSRDFTLRSDIVTRPLPVIAGSAAAPSTVDVIVNGVRTYSQEVGAGPYSITNLPIIAAGGTAQVVIRDSTGRVVEQSLSLFNPARMLATGMSDYSIEGGFARRSFGTLSNDYDKRPVFSGTYRYGVLPWLTLETHAEGGAGLANAGVGFIAGLGGFGTANVALAGSRSPNGTGGQVYLDWQYYWNRISFSVGTQRTFGQYDDLASVTARLAAPGLSGAGALGGGPLGLAGIGFVTVNTRPPRALDRAAVSFPVFDDRTTVSLGAVHLRQWDNTTSKLVTASLSRALEWKGASFYATSYIDRGTNKGFGVFAGLSLPLNDGVFASIGASHAKGSGTALAAELYKSQQQIDGTYGYRLRAGLGENTFGQADASYRSGYGQIAGSVIQSRNATVATAQFDGSIAAMGGGVFIGNKVDTAFAVIDAGAPGVTVMQDNRAIGKTNGQGKYLVPNLRAWERNTLGIDPEGQAVTYDAARTGEVVAPRARSGVYVNFGGRTGVQSAIVVFTGPDGKPLQLGARGRLEGQGETFLVGHDGRAYVKDLGPTNSVVIELLDKECRATFTYAPTEGRQGIVRGVVCR